MVASQSTTFLPLNWNEMTSADRYVIIFCLLIENQTSIAGLVTKISEMFATVSEHTARLDIIDEKFSQT